MQTARIITINNAHNETNHIDLKLFPSMSYLIIAITLTQTQTNINKI
jgi:hypothetical protein